MASTAPALHRHAYGPLGLGPAAHRAVAPERGDPPFERLATLPPSARAVHAFLLRAGPATHRDLVREAGVPARTARFALDRLRRAGLLEERPSLRDARQTYYRAAAGGGGAEDRPPLRIGGW